MAKDGKEKAGMPQGKEFSSEYQPTGEAKSAGWARRRIRENLKRDMFEEFFCRPLKNEKGEDVDTLEQMIRLFRSTIFSRENHNNISPAARTEIALKIIEFLGIKENLNIITGADDKITGLTVKFVDAKTEESNEQTEITLPGDILTGKDE